MNLGCPPDMRDQLGPPICAEPRGPSERKGSGGPRPPDEPCSASADGARDQLPSGASPAQATNQNPLHHGLASKSEPDAPTRTGAPVRDDRGSQPDHPRAGETLSEGECSNPVPRLTAGLSGACSFIARRWRNTAWRRYPTPRLVNEFGLVRLIHLVHSNHTSLAVRDEDREIFDQE